ncbi:MAG TPA: hypothetical protein VGO64_07270 [Candidatus Limnocylindrales bacterium]|jgi:hypothetical protein|nr:hypothetical protein [Candidatus Limnocylindrales bacterium]
MLDDATGAATPEPRCMWCSAVLPDAHAESCPSCGATLVGEADAALPGLTAIDADAILRNTRTAAKPKRSGRLLGWISGEYEGDDSGITAPPGSLAPPPEAVRREMLRLELQAQVANAQAEVEALAADAAIEAAASGRTPPPASAAVADVPTTDANAATDSSGGEDAGSSSTSV